MQPPFTAEYLFKYVWFKKWWKNETNTIADKIGECVCHLHMGIGIYIYIDTMIMLWKLLEHLKPWVMDL